MDALNFSYRLHRTANLTKGTIRLIPIVVDLG